jgi:nucleoside-diphosphate-sugar epimerase
VRVFVAGATGAIGRPLVRQLVEAGHEVTGMTRSGSKSEALRGAGATAVVADAMDAAAVERAVAEARPEAVVHQLTDLPQDFSMRYSYGATSELRTTGTRNLLAGARAAGARRFVAQSVAFIYAPEGGMVKDEEAPTMHGLKGQFAEAIGSTLEMERMVVEADGLEGLALRYGFFYGPGTWYARGTKMADAVLKRRFPIVGEGGGTFPFIHVEDAAAATMAALERGAPGVYNVVDDEPAPMHDWLPGFAEALGGPPPRRVPLWLAKIFARGNAEMATTLRGASNAKAKRELGWAPRYPSWREGFNQGLG